jgi:hypothetical protein
LADGDSPAEALGAVFETVVGWVAVKRRIGAEIPSIEGLDLNVDP